MVSHRTNTIRHGKGAKVWRRKVSTAKRQCLADLLAGHPWPCPECGAELDPRVPALTTWSVEGDHPTDLQHGGTNRQDPVLLHKVCNNRKGRTTTVVIRDAS